MIEESKKKLPLEILREYYIPVTDFPKKYGISSAKVFNLMKSNKIHRGEFYIHEGDRFRVAHADYREVLRELGRDNEI